jgi:hypothetical protein
MAGPTALTSVASTVVRLAGGMVERKAASSAAAKVDEKVAPTAVQLVVRMAASLVGR